MIKRLAKQYQEINEVVSNCYNLYQFPGSGQKPTPVLNEEQFLAVLELLPKNKGSYKLRIEMREKYMRYLRGDESLIHEMIERQEDPEALRRIELRAKVKIRNRRLDSLVMLFGYEGHEARVILGPDGEPWWVGTDVCAILGFGNPWDVLGRHVDDDEKDILGIPDAIGRQRKTTVINESGLYGLIFGSTLPAAKS